VLGLQKTQSREWIFCKIVRPGDMFTTRYTHSVKNRPVWESYTIDAQYRMILNETVYPGTGYGLPVYAGGDEKFSLRPDGFSCISNMHRHIPSLLLRVEPQYNNIFSFNKIHTLNLSKILGNGVVDMRVHQSNIVRYVWRCCFEKKRKS